MNLERALAVNGWMSQVELAYLAEAASKSRMIVEVGSWLGRSTCALAANTNGTVWAVDTWAGTEQQGHDLPDHESLFKQFKENVSGLNVIPVVSESVDAAKRFSCGLDMIFIDANHDYEKVKEDIGIWSPLLKTGGIFCGHDYGGAWVGVTKAVNELIPEFRVVDSIWTTESK
jgi:predicted O-methyltransferase YrrM